jgi:carbamate kinase
VLTQTVVPAGDPAFGNPTKFIGAVYTEAEARDLAGKHGWSVRQDGAHWRRVVASPEPLRIVEEQVIEELLSHGHVVICAGGGGAPVTEDADGVLHGADAVVDKDLTAALLAAAVKADHLLLLTDVSAVMRDFGTPEATPIARLTLAEITDQTFPAGSMGPKVEAARRFVQSTGAVASIGAMDQVSDLLAGRAGTTVSR